MKNTAILLLTCPDRKGVVAAIADFIYRHNGNILHADEHGDLDSGMFKCGWNSIRQVSASILENSRSLFQLTLKNLKLIGGFPNRSNVRELLISFPSMTISWWNCFTG